MSLILCIETGTDVCSVALSQGGLLLSLRESSDGREHSQNLALYIEEMFKEIDLSLDELDAVAVSVGPGSYTGLRIGVSLAKGISYALDIPLIAIGSLDSLVVCAKQDIEEDVLPDISEDTLLIPMIDARRMEVYTQVFNSQGDSLNSVEALVIEDDSFANYKGREIVIFGDGANKCYDTLFKSNERVKVYNVSPSARGLISLAELKWSKKEFVDLAYYEPFYLKNFIGTKTKRNLLDKTR